MTSARRRAPLELIPPGRLAEGACPFKCKLIITLPVQLSIICIVREGGHDVKVLIKDDEPLHPGSCLVFQRSIDNAFKGRGLRAAGCSEMHNGVLEVFVRRKELVLAR